MSASVSAVSVYVIGERKPVRLVNFEGDSDALIGFLDVGRGGGGTLYGRDADGTWHGIPRESVRRLDVVRNG